MTNELFDLVLNAQKGDRESLNEIIDLMSPVIKRNRKKTNYDNRDDLEQEIIAVLIYKIKSYDLSKIPNFTTFILENGKYKDLDLSYSKNPHRYPFDIEVSFLFEDG